jgi:DNA-binding XRE family transcriptional regulator
MSNEQKLKAIRKEKGWSQERLAREIGVSFQTIHRWETGKFQPSQLAQEKIDRLLEKEG